MSDIVERLKLVPVSHFIYHEAAAEITKLRIELAEAEAVIKEANGAINSAYSQADAEWREHDKTASKHDAVVKEWRNKAAAWLEGMARS